MKTVLQNMCMIYNKDTDEILILDKVKKYGWEGLTFVGGHVEAGESLYDSCVREVYEESGYRVSDLKLKGTVSWIDYKSDERYLGFLYYTENFSGELISDNIEGKLFWMKVDDFKIAEGKSESIDEIFKIYMEDEFNEVVFEFENSKPLNCRFF